MPQSPIALVVVLAPLFAGCASRIPGVEPQGQYLPPLLQPTLCSTMSAGMDFAQSVSGWRTPAPTISLEGLAHVEPWDASAVSSRPASYHLQVSSEVGGFRGWYTPVHDPQGLLVYFTGLGQSSDGELAAQVEHAAVEIGWSVLRVDRDDTARPVRFDPVLEAKRAVDAASRLTELHGIPDVRVYMGVSMGGMDGALAARLDPDSVFVGRDPLLSPTAVATWLDRADLRRPDALQMKKFFQRMMCDRYSEPCDVRFAAIIDRSSMGMTNIENDAPSRWLCDLPVSERSRYYIEISSSDPALGPENVQPLLDCGFPLRVREVAGHVPVACEPWALTELVVRGTEMATDRPGMVRSGQALP